MVAIVQGKQVTPDEVRETQPMLQIEGAMEVSVNGDEEILNMGPAEIAGCILSLRTVLAESYDQTIFERDIDSMHGIQRILNQMDLCSRIVKLRCVNEMGFLVDGGDRFKVESVWEYLESAEFDALRTEIEAMLTHETDEF